jgi:hypothetical protein
LSCDVVNANLIPCCRYANALYALLRYLQRQSTCGGEGGEEWLTHQRRRRTYKSPNIPNWLHKQTDDKFADKKFFSPQHVIGSFNLSMRVTNKGTVRICIYDSKTISSMSDAIFGKRANIKNKSKQGRTILSTQYQRFIWDVFL